MFWFATRPAIWACTAFDAGRQRFGVVEPNENRLRHGQGRDALNALYIDGHVERRNDPTFMANGSGPQLANLEDLNIWYWNWPQ